RSGSMVGPVGATVEPRVGGVTKGSHKEAASNVGATEENAMKRFVGSLAVLALLTLTAHGAVAAACDPDGVDAQAIADARADAAAQCDCATAENHGSYVSCVAGVLNARVKNNQLAPSCKGAIQRCAARSTCGKPGFVTCCRTSAKGATKCSTKRDADHCTPPSGGSACVGGFSSCCDACTATGCAPTPTPAPTP